MLKYIPYDTRARRRLWSRLALYYVGPDGGKTSPLMSQGNAYKKQLQTSRSHFLLLHIEYQGYIRRLGNTLKLPGNSVVFYSLTVSHTSGYFSLLLFVYVCHISTLPHSRKRRYNTRILYVNIFQ